MELTDDMRVVFDFFREFFSFIPPVVQSLITFVLVVVVIFALCNTFLKG